MRVSQSLHFFRTSPAHLPCDLEIITSWLFGNSHLNMCKVILTGVLICISSLNGDVEHHFMAYLPFVCLVWKQFYLCSLSTFSRVICIFAVELREFLVYFGYWPLIGYVVCKYFLPLHRLLFRSLDGFFWWAKFLCHVLFRIFFWTLICKAILIFSPISCIFRRFLLAFLEKKNTL